MTLVPDEITQSALGAPRPSEPDRRREAVLATAALSTLLGIIGAILLSGAVASLLELTGSVRVTVFLVCLVLAAAVIALIGYLLAVPLHEPAGRGAALARSNDYSTLAIVAFVAAFITTIPGIVLGHLALRDIARTGRRGRGLAITALVLSYGFLLIGVALWVILIVALDR